MANTGFNQPEVAGWIGNNQSSNLSLDDRIWQKVRTDGDCLVWTGSVSTNGYAQIRVDGKLYTVHRFLWERAHEPLPSGYELDHRCRRRPCVNVSHLEVVTHQENCRRGKNGYNLRGHKNALTLEEMAALEELAGHG